MHFSCTTIFVPRQCCLATTVRFAPSCTDTKCARKYCEYEKRTHPWYLTCNAKASYFQRPLQSIVKIKISKLLTSLSIPAWIIYSETNVLFFFWHFHIVDHLSYYWKKIIFMLIFNLSTLLLTFCPLPGNHCQTSDYIPSTSNVDDDGCL